MEKKTEKIAKKIEK